MKKTFDLLARLKLVELDKRPSKALEAFEKQLREDFKKYISPENYDPLKLADNWLEQVRALAVNGQEGINDESMSKLDKISDLYGGAGETAFMILDMYQAIATVKNEIRAANIKSVMSDYSEHLEKKLKKEGIHITPGQTTGFVNNAGEALTSKQDKLINRYVAISVLKHSFDDKAILNEQDIEQAISAYHVCLQNKPDWSERPFLQKLTDLLSLGLKPLYRAFFSKESKLEEQLHNELNGPGPTQ